MENGRHTSATRRIFFSDGKGKLSGLYVRLFPLSAFARVMESLLVMKVDHDETKKIARQEKGAELRIIS